MVRIGRSSNATIHHTVAGDTLRLVDRTWSLGAEGPGFGFGISYRRPHTVEVAGRIVPMSDPLMIARIVAFSAIVLALMWRRLIWPKT